MREFRFNLFAVLLVLVLSATISACGVEAEKVPEIQYQDALVIRKGGIYTGNYRSTDSKIPAVWVLTEEPVTITGCNIETAGDGIRFETRGQATVIYNNITGIPPSTIPGRAIYCFKPQSVVVEHNYIQGTGGGVMVDQSDVTPAKKIKVRYNQFKNLDKRKADPNDLVQIEHRAGVMLSGANDLTDAEISWNEFVHEAGKSWIEDVINLFNSGGRESSPVLIHDNFIFGAYPWPLSAKNYTGSGITVDGDPSHKTLATTSKFIRAYNNQIISTCNACMNIAAGHDVHFYGNTMISSGRYPDGTPSDRFWGGFCIYDGSDVGPAVFKNNSIENNTVGYVRHGVNTPFPNRQDYVRHVKTPDDVDYTKNTFLPNPITLETEKAEYPKWQKKLETNKISIGNTTEPRKTIERE